MFSNYINIINFNFDIVNYLVNGAIFLMGVVYIAIDENKKEASAKYIICESDNPTQNSPDKVELIDNKVKCPNGYS